MSPILALTDLSARSDRAILRAAHMAQALDAPLEILHVVDEDLPAALQQTHAEEAEAVLRAMIAEHATLSALTPAIHVENGHIVKLVASVAAERGAQMIVIGSHRNRGLAEVVTTPTLIGILRALALPVLVVVGPPEASYASVLAGSDFSDAGRAAADLARKVAPHADIHLLHAWQATYDGVPYAYDASALTMAAQTELSDALNKEATRIGGNTSVELLAGGAGNTLLRTARARESDLVAVGRHARSGVARFFVGDTAEGVALYAPCDVLVAAPG